MRFMSSDEQERMDQRGPQPQYQPSQDDEQNFFITEDIRPENAIKEENESDQDAMH